MRCEDACRPGPNRNERVRLTKNGLGPNTDYLMYASERILFVQCIYFGQNNDYVVYYLFLNLVYFYGRTLSTSMTHYLVLKK